MLIKQLPIFCINLDRSKERWKSVIKNFDDLGQPVVRVSACDGKELTKDDVPKLWGDLNFFGSGIAGCALSHYKLWQFIIKNNIDYSCILEDDAHVVMRIENIEAPDNFDVLYISSRVGGDSQNKVMSGCGTESYIVSKAGCEKLLAVCEDMFKPVDLRIQSHMRGFKEHQHTLCEGYSSPTDPFHSLKNSNIIIEAYKTLVNYTVHNDNGVSYVNE
jgi:glycosyl transferase family 25